MSQVKKHLEQFKLILMPPILTVGSWALYWVLVRAGFEWFLVDWIKLYAMAIFIILIYIWPMFIIGSLYWSSITEGKERLNTTMLLVGSTAAMALRLLLAFKP